MNVFIDESGDFTPKGFSVVCALSVPTKATRRARREIIAISEKWPHVKGELKSGSLSPDQITLLIDTLFRHEALLHCFAIDVSAEAQSDIMLIPREIAHHSDFKSPTIPK